jgi:two-component system, sensor histidine kinase YesM
MTRTPQHHRIPFSYKLMLVYMLTFILLVAGIGTYSYHSSVRFEQERTRENFTATIRQIKDNITYKASVVDRIAEQIYLDQSLQKLLTNRYSGYDSYNTMTNSIRPRIEAALNTPIFPVHMTLYQQNESLPEIYYDNTEIDPLDPIYGRRYEIYHTSRLEAQPWYDRTATETYRSRWLQLDRDGALHNISFVRPLIDFRSLSQIGLLRLSVKLSSLMDGIDYTKIGENGHIVVVDQHSHVLFSDDKNLIRQPLGSLDLDSYFVISEPVEPLQMQIHILVPQEELTRNAVHIRNTTIIMCLISVIAFSFVGFLLSQYSSKQISKLITSFDAIREGDFGRRIDYKGNDEFADIAHAFNDMARNIQELITEVYETKLQKKEAQLQVLQAQINPHFLYNSLSTISRMAKLGEVDTLHTMVMGLARFYRLTLNNGRMIIPIAQEIEQVKAYLDIQQVKYLSRLHVVYEIDPRVCSYDTVHMILQPFVENCLEHAWSGDSLTIIVQATMCTDSIVFEIVDDGVGFPDDVQVGILTTGGESIGYGIRNVDERIKLQFGPQYGVTIASTPHHGSRISIRVPLFRKHPLDPAREPVP